MLFVLACSLSISSYTKRANPSAEQPAVDFKGGGGGAARLLSRPVPQDPGRLPQSQLYSTDKTRIRLQGQLNQESKTSSHFYHIVDPLYYFSSNNEGSVVSCCQLFLQIPLDSKTNEIEQKVEPHNDYFSTQFLLNFSILGTHMVSVEASVVDTSGIEWKTGPKITVSVKSLEDPYSQQLRHQLQQQQQTGPQPGPQRNILPRQ